MSKVILTVINRFCRESCWFLSLIWGSATTAFPIRFEATDSLRVKPSCGSNLELSLTVYFKLLSYILVYMLKGYKNSVTL